ncbi:MAG: alpha-1,4-glucan--maltose-1-phosphate maltosyltransferase [Myxococcales bacterium]|nr:alpha-1,4-glucan--maltose-1-phosphate maltosyltransferase [Myxococcales bacterium]
MVGRGRARTQRPPRPRREPPDLEVGRRALPLVGARAADRPGHADGEPRRGRPRPARGVRDGGGAGARRGSRRVRPVGDGRQRVVVLAMRPEVDGGRYPAKRILDEPVTIEADLLADGHDVLAAVLQYRHAADEAWRETPLTPAGNDTWRATFTPTRLGRYQCVALGWVDAFATWRHGLERKVAAGADVTVELLEGAALIEAAAARSTGIDRGPLAAAATTVRGPGPLPARIAAAADVGLAAAIARHPDRTRATGYRHPLELHVERPLARCAAWYELFPRSTGPAGRHGTLRDAEARLAYVAELGFDILYLPPIHPIGQAFRKGPDNAPVAGPDDPGSPWAIGGAAGGHTSVHPDLGTLADFDHFVAAARDHGLEVALDIALQASPDHPWVTAHPTWFRARPDGSIQYAENPPKRYQDVYPFDFESADWEALWDALLGIFLFWAERGVRCFRVDNPHTKPLPFWEWCIAQVQATYPDALFLAEAFTRPKLTYALAKGGFSQSYTYFTWRTTKLELTRYLEELTQTDVADYFRPNFWPTTPDIFPEHLVHGGPAAFVARAILAGTLASAYGIYGPSYELMEHTPRVGAEELAQNEKYQLRAWDLDRPDSLRHVLARLNRIRRAHPALHANRSLRFHPCAHDLVLCFSKRTADHRDVILVVVNLDPHHTHGAWLDLDLAELGVAADEAFQVHDLLGDAHYLWRGPRNYVELAPGVMPAHVFELRRLVRREQHFEYFL